MGPGFKLILIALLCLAAGYGLIATRRVFENYKNQIPIGRMQPLPFVNWIKWLAIGLGVLIASVGILLLVTGIWTLFQD